MTTRKHRRLPNRPEAILDAASKVLGRNGPREMTIEAVAGEAGLSKGGVLHHYPSKDAMIAAMVERKLGDLRRGMASYARGHAEDVETLTLSLVRYLQRHYGDEDDISRALLAASIDNSSALEGYRSFVAEGLVIPNAEDELAPRNTVVFLAVMGLLLGRALKLHDISGEQAISLFRAFEGVVGDRQTLEPDACNP